MSLGDMIVAVKDFCVDWGGMIFLILGLVLLVVTGWRLFLGLLYQDMFKYELVACILGFIFGIIFIIVGWTGLRKLSEVSNEFIEDNYRQFQENNGISSDDDGSDGDQDDEMNDDPDDGSSDDDTGYEESGHESDDEDSMHEDTGSVDDDAGGISGEEIYEELQKGLP